MANQVLSIGSILLLLTCLLPVTTEKADVTDLFLSDEGVISDVEEYVSQTVMNLNIPGAALALVKEGDIVHTSAYGKISTGEYVHENTPFLIGSISKTLTSYGILQLVAQNKIQLEDEVQKHLPMLSIPPGPDGRVLTIEHLLTHRSGISMYDGMRYADLGLDQPEAVSQTLQEFFSENIVLKPGADFAYSAANYLMLGGVIESVSGEHYSDYMQQHVFESLGMTNAAADKEGADRKGLVNGYQSWFGFNIPSHIDYDNAGAPYGYIAASATDMGHFLAELQLPGVSSQPPVLMMVQKPAGISSNYGYGVRFLQNGDISLIGHGGSNADFRSEMWLVEGTDWGFVLLTNRNYALEEHYLVNAAFDIAAIMTGNHRDPLQYPAASAPFILLGILCITGILSIIWWHYTRKNKHILNRSVWMIISILMLGISAGLIPFFLYIFGVPWHTLWLFAPDISVMLILLSLIFLSNFLFAVRFAP